jgi:hypothetical protein
LGSTNFVWADVTRRSDTFLLGQKPFGWPKSSHWCLSIAFETLLQRSGTARPLHMAKSRSELLALVVRAQEEVSAVQ